MLLRTMTNGYIHFVSAYLLVNNGLEMNTQVSCGNVKYLELSHL